MSVTLITVMLINSAKSTKQVSFLKGAGLSDYNIVANILYIHAATEQCSN